MIWAGACAAPPSEVRLLCGENPPNNIEEVGTCCLLLARRCIYFDLDLMELLPQNALYHLFKQRAKEAFDLCSIDLHSRSNVLVGPRSD